VNFLKKAFAAFWTKLTKTLPKEFTHISFCNFSHLASLHSPSHVTSCPGKEIAARFPLPLHWPRQALAASLAATYGDDIIGHIRPLPRILPPHTAMTLQLSRCL
jgi:hypothetical protein